MTTITRRCRAHACLCAYKPRPSISTHISTSEHNRQDEEVADYPPAEERQERNLRADVLQEAAGAMVPQAEVLPQPDSPHARGISRHGAIRVRSRVSVEQRVAGLATRHACAVGGRRVGSSGQRDVVCCHDGSYHARQVLYLIVREREREAMMAATMHVRYCI